MAGKKRNRGRQTTYDQETADRICRLLASGMTLRAVCRRKGMPDEATVRTWVAYDREGFAAQYAKSREIGYQCMADEIIEIADDSSSDTCTDKDGNRRADHEVVQRSRLRVDVRKWLLSKALPKVYGDKVSAELVGPDGGPVQHTILPTPLTDDEWEKKHTTDA